MQIQLTFTKKKKIEGKFTKYRLFNKSLLKIASLMKIF